VRRPRPLVLWPLVAVAGLALVVGLALFQPWRLFTSTTVIEAAPGAASPSSPASPASSASAPSVPVSSASASSAPAAPVTVAAGDLIPHEHATSGGARLLALPDGSHVLRLEGLDTSDGPDLHVWLTDRPVIEGRDGWGVFDDGRYVDLGSLKGNKGDQNYPLPAGTDVDTLTSVSIWCARFHVSFGAAALTPVAG
jgi:hypothetical protein